VSVFQIVQKDTSPKKTPDGVSFMTLIVPVASVILLTNVPNVNQDTSLMVLLVSNHVQMVNMPTLPMENVNLVTIPVTPVTEKNHLNVLTV
jgi:hypothetical protein